MFGAYTVYHYDRLASTDTRNFRRGWHVFGRPTRRFVPGAARRFPAIRTKRFGKRGRCTQNQESKDASKQQSAAPQ
jgi:hypothetical protein